MVELDYKARSIQFHRRAQAAEALAEKWINEAGYWKTNAHYSGVRWHKEACEVQRLKTALWRATLHHTDALTRIIHLGREFP